MRRRTYASVLVIALAATPGRALADDGTAGGAGPQVVSDAVRAEARAHFEKGLDLLRRGDAEAALAEFLRSRALQATRAATKNAGVALHRLGRSDEALVMFERLLAEFKNVPEADRRAIEAEIAQLHDEVGTLTLSCNEAGATVSIDDAPVGVTPLATAIYLTPKKHALRVEKVGFLPFEQAIDVAARATSTVDAELRVESVGTITVVEVHGEPAQVYIDGARAGAAGIDYVVKPGNHVLEIRLGARASVPRAITIAGGGRERFEFTLPADVAPPAARERDRAHGSIESPDAAPTGAPSRAITLEATGGILVSAIGGDVSGGCRGACVPALGGSVAMRVGYRFGRFQRFGLAVELGYAGVRDGVDRPATVTPVGIAPQTGVADDVVRYGGPTAAIVVSYQHPLGSAFLVSAGLGLGYLFGAWSDARTGTFETAGGTKYQTPLVIEQGTAGALMLRPEIALGYRLTDVWTLTAGVQVPLLVLTASPAWRDEQEVPAGTCPNADITKCAGRGSFGAASTLGASIVSLSPVASLRAAF
jgi:hypothetical protein